MDNESDDPTPDHQTASRETWERLAGPFTDIAGAAEQLGCTPAAVEERIACRELLAARVAGGDRDWVLPLRQFEVPDQLLPRVLARAGYRPQRDWSGWEIAAWLASADEELGLDTAYEALRAGKIDNVMAQASLVEPAADGPPDLLSSIQNLVSMDPEKFSTAAATVRNALRHAATELLHRPAAPPEPSEADSTRKAERFQAIRLAERLEVHASWVLKIAPLRGERPRRRTMWGDIARDARSATDKLRSLGTREETLAVARRLEVHAGWLAHLDELYGTDWSELASDLIDGTMALRSEASDQRAERAPDRVEPEPDAEAASGVTYLLVDVVAVRVLSRYVVELTFDNGAVKVIDLEPWLVGPAFEEVRGDYDAFCAVVADPESGTIVFPNGADLSPGPLYTAAKPARPS